MTKFDFEVSRLGNVELVTHTFSYPQGENPKEELLVELLDAVTLQLNHVRSES